MKPRRVRSVRRREFFALRRIGIVYRDQRDQRDRPVAGHPQRLRGRFGAKRGDVSVEMLESLRETYAGVPKGERQS